MVGWGRRKEGGRVLRCGTRQPGHPLAPAQVSLQHLTPPPPPPPPHFVFLLHHQFYFSHSSLCFFLLFTTLSVFYFFLYLPPSSSLLPIIVIFSYYRLNVFYLFLLNFYLSSSFCPSLFLLFIWFLAPLFTSPPPITRLRFPHC